MSLFEKKKEYASSAPLYTLGSNKTILIIGLGNRGKEYDSTRHNVGFAAIDDFAKRNEFPGWADKKSLKATLTDLKMGENKVILIKPTTFMNNSGEAAQAVQRFYRIYNSTTVAVYDELAIEFGQIRARVGGSDAGHNGVKSLIAHIGEDFGRLRIGVGNEIAQKTDAANFVLSKFSKQEQESMPAILKEASVMLTEYIFSGQLPHETRNVL